MQIIITTLFNSVFALINYIIAKEITNNIDFAKTGVYFTIMISPILYSLLFNNFFLPITNKMKLEGSNEKHKLNKKLLFFSLLALGLTTITLIPNAMMNKFFDFQTIDIPWYLILLFISTTLLSVILIWSTYKLFTYINNNHINKFVSS